MSRLYWNKPEEWDTSEDYRKLSIANEKTAKLVKVTPLYFKRTISYDDSVFKDERYKHDLNSDSKVVVIVENLKKTHYLMVQSYNNKWGFPKGCLETTDDPLAGATKELLEETGIALRAKDKLYSYNTIFDRTSSQLTLRGDKMYIYHLYVSMDKPINIKDIDYEISAIKWVSKAKGLKEMDQSKVLNRITNSILYALDNSEINLAVG